MNIAYLCTGIAKNITDKKTKRQEEMKRNEKLSMPTLDKAASFMAVSVPLLWLSYMMAAKIYAASHLIPHEVLLVSCFVLLESLVLKCTSFLIGSEDSGSAFCKTPQGSASKALPAGETSLAEEERHLKVYAQSAAESQLSTEAYRQRLKEAVHEYLYRVMAPILEQEEMHALWLEYESWIDSPHYRPIPRDWKWKKGKDVRHRPSDAFPLRAARSHPLAASLMHFPEMSYKAHFRSLCCQ